ncbi:MAG: TolB family protein, partial [Planctomycetota bacterium]
MKTTRILAISVWVLVVGLPVGVAKADFTFGTPTNLGPTVNSSAHDYSPSISADGLELYFTSIRPGGEGSSDLWVSTRATKNDPWGELVNLGPVVNSSAPDDAPDVSADGLALLFGSSRPGGSGGDDIWVSTRATTEDDWGTPVNLGPTVNSPASDSSPSISTDGLTLYFASQRPGGYGGRDVWVTTRATKEDDWGTPVNLGPTVNSSAHDNGPCIWADGRTLFWGSKTRPGGEGYSDLWVTMRT